MERTNIHELFESADDDYIERFKDRYWDKIDKSGDCWEWEATRLHSGGGAGHGSISWTHKGTKTQLLSHRVAKYLSVGESISNKNVNHSCLNSGCQNPDHMYVGTQEENCQDEDFSKLTKEDVIDIRMKGYRGLVFIEIADEYPVTKDYISKICREESWQNVGGPIKGRQY